MQTLHRLLVCFLLIALAMPFAVSAGPLEKEPDVTGEGAAGGLITRITPARESVIQTRRPVIAAYFGNWGSGVAFARIRMWVNGQEVNPQVRSTAMVSYRPFVPLPLGRTGVQLQVFDQGGLRADVVWAFTIQSDDGSISIPGGGTDYQGPIITSVRPARESVVNTTQPIITATFADRGAGVDPARTRMWVDGQEVAPQVRNASIVQYQPRNPLPPRRIGVEVWVFDRYGNRSDLVWAFSIGGSGSGIPGGGFDQQGPFVTSINPGREDTVGNRFPLIAVTFADRGAGVDPSRTRLWVNGQEVAPQIRSTTRVQYRPLAPLPIGRVGVQAWIYDHSGNRTDIIWAFTVVQ